jgi:large subunit ribosomal protein L31
MKADLHPKYQFVVFKDVTTNTQFITKSSIDLGRHRETVNIDGVDYPLVLVDVSADSHPFYTGQQKLMDTEGRVDRFYRKYGFKQTETTGE